MGNSRKFYLQKKKELENYLHKNQKQNKSYVSKGKVGKHSILEYKILKKLNNYYHLEIQPKTGRHHQIRYNFLRLDVL